MSIIIRSHVTTYVTKNKKPLKNKGLNVWIVDLLGLEPRMAEPKTAVLPITP